MRAVVRYSLHLAAIAVLAWVAAALRECVRYFPGRSISEWVVPTIHRVLPRGHTFSGWGKLSDPHLRASERVLRDQSGSIDETWSRLFREVVGAISTPTLALVIWHMTST